MSEEKDTTAPPVQEDQIAVSTPEPGAPPAEVESMQDKIAKYLSGEGVKVADDPEEINRRIVTQILSAQTPEEVITPVEVQHARDLIDIPLEIADVSWNQSDYEAGNPWYAIVDAKRVDTGESIVVTCGGQKVMAQLFKYAIEKWFPMRAAFRQSERPTSAGYYPLRLEKV